MGVYKYEPLKNYFINSKIKERSYRFPECCMRIEI